MTTRVRLWFVGLLALLLPVMLLPSVPVGAQAEPAATTYRIHLPMLATERVETPPPPPPPALGGVFPVDETRTTSPAILLDAAGGTHIAMAGYGPASERPPVYYGYCAPGKDCVSPTSWQLTAIDANAEQAQLQLSPAGKPRIIYRTGLNAAGTARDYYYAECNGACTSAASWAKARIASTTRTDPLEWELPQRSFALDRLGRPRFVYYTGTAGDPNKGAFYLSCDSGCASAANWRRGAISVSSTVGGEIFDDVALVFTSQNQPRFVTNLTASRDGIYYFACDANCTDSASWGRVFLADRGFGPLASWDIELDGQDRPRVAIYLEGFRDGGGDFLAYIWCDAGCAASGDNWFGGPVGLPQGEGETPDLELDARGRPRIAYHAAESASLGLLWCNAGCEGDGAEWSQAVPEQSADLDARHPILLPPACERGAWASGFQPMLVLDAQGNPRVASEAKRLLRCLVRDPQDPSEPPQSQIVEYRHVRVLIARLP